jgi:uncharacterized protein (TIGR02270 family)
LSTVIESIITRHVQEAGFLWLLRDGAVLAPHYSLKDLAKLDDRVEAHLDGLRIAGGPGWEICKEAMGEGEAGEIFAAGVMAFERGHESPIQSVLEVVSEKPEFANGLVSALGWMPFPQAAEHIKNLFVSEVPILRRSAIAASAVHREDPGKHLVDALLCDEPSVKSRALRAVGELRRGDLISVLWAEMNSADSMCRYFAAWSASLLGDAGAAEVLKAFSVPDAPWREEAARTALNRMELSDAIGWQTEMARNPDMIRLAAIGAGVIGDPVLVPWLVEQMKAPLLARVAGEAFTMITGVDIAYEDLEGERPEGFEAGPTENPEDENVEMDPDEDLPWPDPELVQGWWGKKKGRFRSGTRYLLGQPISFEHLNQVLRTGRQRQRAAAALELAISKPGIPLFEVRAPGFRQKNLLGIR